MENSGSDSRDAPSGCGIEDSATPITINISTTTGGNFTQTVETHYTVENLKKIVAKKLRVAKDRICLLHRERVSNLKTPPFCCHTADWRPEVGPVRAKGPERKATQFAGG
uniref:Uncharacterized protein n=1 Tax=Phlebotomus papatasi TaxID=29031 RepID=A0A1B0CYF9_PHLPP